jgi:hypothetical protein
LGVGAGEDVKLRLGGLRRAALNEAEREENRLGVGPDGPVREEVERMAPGFGLALYPKRL